MLDGLSACQVHQVPGQDNGVWIKKVTGTYGKKQHRYLKENLMA